MESSPVARPAPAAALDPRRWWEHPPSRDPGSKVGRRLGDGEEITVDGDLA
jgi:hypothetical protein